MTEEEVVFWLGLDWPLPGGKRLRPEIAAGMAHVHPPGFGEGDQEAKGGGHLRVFAAFLACAGRPGPGRLVHIPPEDYPDACPPAGVYCWACGATHGCDAPDG